MSTQPLSPLSDRLQRLIEEESGTIHARVAREALDYENPEDFFRDLITGGCASGFVGSLIYIWDTHAFFERHYDEIEYLREDWEVNMGAPFKINGDLKNTLAWFGFEEVAYRMFLEFEDEGLIQSSAW